jgi:hypothetical protein
MLHNMVWPSNFLALETSFCPYPPTAKKSCRHFTLKRASVKRMPKDRKKRAGWCGCGENPDVMIWRPQATAY